MPSASVERVLAHLWALDCNPRGSDDRGYSARCPAHEDRNPSLSVGQGHDGRALVYCHRGCALEEIAAALHMDMTELFEPDDKPVNPTPKRVVERYDYVDEQGRLLYQVERLEPKGFRQRRPESKQTATIALREEDRPRILEVARKRNNQDGYARPDGTKTDLDTDEFEGAASECAFARWLGVEWEGSYGDPSKIDVVDPRTGARYDVKHGLELHYRLNVAQCHMDKHGSDAIGIWVTGTWPKYTLHGWATFGEIQARGEQVNLGERDKWFLPNELLHPMSDIRPSGGWDYKLGDVRRVLYRLPEVIAAVKAGQKICVVEGERDVHTLEAKGQVATTCPGGAGKWRPEYSETLRGALVAIIQDVDPADPKTGHHPGQEHAAAVRDALTGVAEKVKVLQPAVGSDVTDHVQAGLPLGALIEATEPRPPQGLQVLSAREMMALPDPDTSGYLLGPLLYRGHRIVVGGWTGHGKTTFTMHMVSAACYGRQFLNWKGKGGLHALVVDVEQGQRTVKRILRETNLEKADRVSYLRIPDGLALDTDEEAIASMERIFAAGVGGERYDIVLADPLYKLSRGNPNDARAATDLMRRFDDWRERYGFALILPMHCRKPQPDSQLSPHDLFGSSAYQWGAEMLLGIQRKSKSLSWLHWWKDREGEVAEDGGTVGSHWDILFDRQRGFTYHDKGKQGQLIAVEPTPRFDLARFIYEEIRNTGPVSRRNIKDKAWLKFHLHYNDGMLDRALERVGGYGVISNGAPRKADRIYFLQDALEGLTNHEPRPETEALPSPDNGEGVPEEVVQP